jgi:hypothetical protein
LSREEREAEEDDIGKPCFCQRRSGHRPR